MAGAPRSSLDVADLPSPLDSTSPLDPTVLRLERVTRAYGRQFALREVTLALQRGSFLALLGPNGAGKTTLLRVAAGLARPTAGRVLFEGSADEAGRRMRPRLGYLSHRTLLYDALTARQNLVFFARLYGVQSPAERATGLLRALDLERHADRAVATFSRGMQQRLALARALVHAPSLLLLDEPYTGLDADGTRRLTAALRELKARGVTVLLTTHALDAPLELADEVGILAAGELRHHGPRAGLSPADLAELYARATRAEGRLGGSDLQGQARIPPAPPAAVEPSRTAAPPRTAGAPRIAEPPPLAGPRPDTEDGPSSAAVTRLGALLAKDLLLEWRRKEQVVAMAVFALLAAILFVFAVDPTPGELLRLGPGALWISFLFAGTLGLAKVFAPEERNGALTALLLAPVDRSALFLAKAASAALFMGLMELLMTPVFVALFDLPLAHVLPAFALLAAVTTVGFCLPGTLLGFVTARAAARELLLPILLLPLALPLLIAAAKATRILLEGAAGPGAAGLSLWLALILAFDAVFGVLCAWGFERAVEE